MLDLLQIVCLFGVFYGVFHLGKFMEELRDSVIELNDRLSKLEKDAVKITFSNPPFSTQDEKVIVHPEVKNKPNNPYYRGPGTKVTPKVMGEWQTKNKTKPLIEGRVKSTTKGDTGTTKALPPLPARKPKNWNK